MFGLDYRYRSHSHSRCFLTQRSPRLNARQNAEDHQQDRTDHGQHKDPPLRPVLRPWAVWRARRFVFRVPVNLAAVIDLHSLSNSNKNTYD
jgi:hypothetical protein